MEAPTSPLNRGTVGVVHAGMQKRISTMLSTMA
jgi:hypothetical protein